MGIDEKIRRINELYHKSQAEGLTDAEKKEQLMIEIAKSKENNQE